MLSYFKNIMNMLINGVLNLVEKCIDKIIWCVIEMDYIIHVTTTKSKEDKEITIGCNLYELIIISQHTRLIPERFTRNFIEDNTILDIIPEFTTFQKGMWRYSYYIDLQAPNNDNSFSLRVTECIDTYPLGIVKGKAIWYKERKISIYSTIHYFRSS